MMRVNKAFLAVAGAAVITAAFLSAWHRQRRNDRRRGARKQHRTAVRLHVSAHAVRLLDAAQRRALRRR